MCGCWHDGWVQRADEHSRWIFNNYCCLCMCCVDIFSGLVLIVNTWVWIITACVHIGSLCVTKIKMLDAGIAWFFAAVMEWREICICYWVCLHKLYGMWTDSRFTAVSTDNGLNINKWVMPAIYYFGRFLPRDALLCKARYCDRMSSVCPSMTLVDQDHIGWNSWKLTARTISPTPSLFVAQTPSTYSQGNMGKFGVD